MGMFEQVALWLLVLNLGVVCGAGLYETRISIPRWAGTNSASGPQWKADEANQDDVGRRFWAFATTGPLTLITLVNLWLAWKSTGELRAWWLAAGATVMIDRLMTFSYFIPRMVRLMKMADSAEARALMAQWTNLNYVRQVVAVAAWVLAIHALGLFYRRGA